MIFFSIGLPGRFAEWCDWVIARLANHLGGSVIVDQWPSLSRMLGYEGISSALDEVALSLIKTGAAHLVMGARQPEERLRAALADTNARFVVALDDPRTAVADILRQSNGELRAVTRAVANSCPLVMRYGSLAGALTLHAERAKADLAGAVAAIANHFAIAANAAEVRTIIDQAAEAGRDALPAGRDDWGARIPTDAHKMVDGALTGYRECFAGGSLTEIVWTRDLFILDGQGGEPSGVSELSGSTCIRPFIYGPYIHVPPGDWTARVLLGLSREAARYRFLVDAYSGGLLGSTSVRPEGGGIYAAYVNFSVSDPSGQGVEVRVWVDANNARGELAFGNVVLRPLATRHTDIGTGSSNDFRTVLDL